MGTLNIDAVTNAATACAGITTGVALSGLATTDVVVVNEIAGTYTAWNAWGTTVTCTNPAGCSTDTEKGWMNQFSVCVGGVRNQYGSLGLCFPTAAYAKAAWDSLYPNGFTLTGQTEYIFWISDSNPPDNVGGISLQYTVFPRVSNALMFSCNT